jgi:hypothetical protein
VNNCPQGTLGDSQNDFDLIPVPKGLHVALARPGVSEALTEPFRKREQRLDRKVSDNRPTCSALDIPLPISFPATGRRFGAADPGGCPSPRQAPRRSSLQGHGKQRRGAFWDRGSF